MVGMAETVQEKKFDLDQFIRENETVRTIAYEHALDIVFIFAREMDKQGLTQKELAKLMDMKPSRLSKLLNTQPNLTLETIAKFEKALGIRVEFSVKDSVDDYCKSINLSTTNARRIKRPRIEVEKIAQLDSMPNISNSKSGIYPHIDLKELRSAA